MGRLIRNAGIKKDGNKKENNRGLTLVELLVSITILTIVVGAAMSFFVHAINLYHRGSQEANLQNEAQLTMTQLQSMVVNASHGVSVGVGSPSLSGNNLYVYNRETDATGVNQYKVTHVYQDGEKLMYCYMNYSLNPDGSSSLSADKENPLVLSEYIENFMVDLTQLQSKNSIDIQLDFKCKDRTYSTRNTFLLRNSISREADGSPDDYFKEDAVADKGNQITEITLNPGEVYMWQGSQMASPFSVVASVGGKNISGAQVVWNLISGTGVEINRSTGTIKAEKDASGDAVVEATALSSINAGGSYVSNTATVHIKSFTGVSLSSVKPVSNEDHKTYTGTFYVNGGNLQKEVDMEKSPVVMDGSTVSATFEKVEGTSDSSSLRWKVSVKRPGNYLGKTYTLKVGYTLNGRTEVATLDGIKFLPSDSEQTQVATAVQLKDTGTGVIYSGGIGAITVNRGASQNLIMQVMYGDSSAWETLDADEWSITTDDSNVKVSSNGQGYRLDYDVEDYASTVHVNLSTSYYSGDGNDKPGPGLKLTFNPVNIRLNFAVGTQSKFPVTRGKTDNMTFEIDNLEGASVCLLNKGDSSSRDSMYISVNDTKASVTVNENELKTRNFYFGVRTASGKVLPDEIACKVTLVPGVANLYYDLSNSTGEAYIPKISEITAFDSGKTQPTANSPTILYTVSGKMITYTYDSSVRNYNVNYNGHSYYDAYKDHRVYRWIMWK